MPRWLVDDPSLVYFFLGLAALVLGVFWWMSRQESSHIRSDTGLVTALRTGHLERRHIYLLGLVVVALLAGLVWLLHSLVETDGKKIEHAINEMAVAVAAKDTNKIFANISDSFRLASRDKAGFRGLVDSYVKNGGVDQLSVWDYEAKEVSRKTRKATVIFKVKAKGPAVPNDAGYRCKAIFVLDPDEHWRLQTFQLYMPQIDPMKGEPLQLPF